MVTGHSIIKVRVFQNQQLDVDNFLVSSRCVYVFRSCDNFLILPHRNTNRERAGEGKKRALSLFQSGYCVICILRIGDWRNGKLTVQRRERRRWLPSSSILHDNGCLILPLPFVVCHPLLSPGDQEDNTHTTQHIVDCESTIERRGDNGTRV